MRDDIAAHLRDTPLTTLALFSVTHTSKGALNTGQRGYRLITGDTGRTIIREAHERGTRVELVYTSFGTKRNRALFESRTRQDAVIASLVALVDTTKTDGINVDVEALDPTLVPAYSDFVRRLGEAVRAADPGDEVSAATGAGTLGAAMAVAAADGGADRIFLMGYDYRVAASSPGASAPLDRSDGGQRSLRWSLDLYQALGVPADRLLLGLPLYGMTWPTAGPVIGAPETGRGEAWIPRQHTDMLLDESITPQRDQVEQVDVYLQASDGTWGPPPPGASLTPAEQQRTWTAIYVDSPATLAPKMALADERGLAGSGFWAIGYERGLPGYRELMAAFVAGDPLP
jgi:spore germination protein YaaH